MRKAALEAAFQPNGYISLLCRLFSSWLLRRLLCRLLYRLLYRLLCWLLGSGRGSARVDLFLHLRSNLPVALFRQRKSCQQTEGNETDNEAPSQFFDEISRFFDAHELISSDDAGSDSAAFGVLDQDDQHKEDANDDEEDSNGGKHCFIGLRSTMC